MSADTGFVRLRDYCTQILTETRDLLDRDAPADDWLALVERRAERDVEAELEPVARQLLARGRRLGNKPAVRRAIADATGSLMRLVMFHPHAGVPFPFVVRELRGRLKRLRALVGSSSPLDAADEPGPDPLDRNEAEIMSALVTIGPVGWKDVATELKGAADPELRLGYDNVRRLGAGLIGRKLVERVGGRRFAASDAGKAVLAAHLNCEPL